MSSEKIEKPEKSKKDSWEKADIILRPVGALITALTVALLGLFANYFITQYQERDAKSKLITELQSHREDAESALRKDMFNSIMSNILSDKSHVTLDEKILQLELLAYNFHESLNLMPLFEYLSRLNNTLNMSDSRARDGFRDRLIKMSDAVISKQIATLEESFKARTFVYEDTLKVWEKIQPFDHDDSIYKKEVIDPLIKIDKFALFEGASTFTFDDSIFNGKTYDSLQQTVRIQVIDYNLNEEWVKIKLKIQTARPKKGQDQTHQRPHNSTFTVNHFEFPMIDNTKLENDMRLAVVLHCFNCNKDNPDLRNQMRIEFSVIYFPNSLASLKEKSNFENLLNKAQSIN